MSTAGSTVDKLKNGDSAAFWQAIAGGQLVVQQCRDCGNIQHPPRVQCTKCWSADIEGLPCSGRATLESSTIVRRAPLPEFRAQVPYVIGSVILEEGPRMITEIVGEGALDVQIGDRLLLDTTCKGDNLPRFVPVSA